MRALSERHELEVGGVAVYLLYRSRKKVSEATSRFSDGFAGYIVLRGLE